ncbi:MAG: glycosyl transferase [Ignavibacteriae bacterium HGW-Ignavibacteriae-2]|jgi:cellulose synthase/poly-beta-1,6-N-acetylglucosamine synthase-like glycosyltransferase|nr:MAG: glycosyl transferase [Ignavibacteriae bacterium HGW-Ignavibacteriae-2]
MYELIFLIALSLYFLQIIIFIIGAGKKYNKISEADLPSISIIVAARNEENNILECISSLDNLIYPSDKIEIIIVNDNSTDRTGEIIKKFASGKSKFKVLESTDKIGNLKGKANAIANAIKKSSGEVILTTDADCSVSPTWAKTLASHYRDDVAIVCGYTNQFDENIFEGMQSVDFIYLLTVAAGTMNLGKPLSCIGNNMSYRRSVYEEVGGYEAIPFSVTEDFKLLMTIHSLKKYKIIYPLEAEGLVTSKACSDFKSLYWQKKRWGVGGLDSDLIGYSVMASGFVAHICMLILPFLFSVNALYLTVFKIFTDYYFIKSVYKKLNLKLKFSHFAAFELYFILYVIWLPISVTFSRNVKWKGREYTRK